MKDRKGEILAQFCESIQVAFVYLLFGENTENVHLFSAPTA